MCRKSHSSFANPNAMKRRSQVTSSTASPSYCSNATLSKPVQNVARLRVVPLLLCRPTKSTVFVRDAADLREGLCIASCLSISLYVQGGKRHLTRSESPVPRGASRDPCDDSVMQVVWNSGWSVSPDLGSKLGSGLREHRQCGPKILGKVCGICELNPESG